jgi:hypothetical protein
MRRVHWIFRTWSRMLQGRTGTGCPSYGEEAGGPPTIPLIRDRRSAIHDPISSAFLCDLCGLAVNLSVRVGDARPRRPTGDGLGQDVPATVKMRARCPRSRVESGFISDLGLSTFGPSALHFQNLSVLVFQLLPDGVGQMLVQAENFRKKFRVLSIAHLRVPLKHAKRGDSRFKWAV